LSDQQYWQFQVLQEELLKWNKKINLTAIRDKKGIQEKHFFDSLTCFMGFEEWPESLIDVGSGAGFPGLPVKIIIPELRLTLVESVDKKADFCRHIVETLGLSDVTVLSKRVEEVAHMPQHREAYDIATRRRRASPNTGGISLAFGQGRWKSFDAKRNAWSDGNPGSWKDCRSLRRRD